MSASVGMGLPAPESPASVTSTTPSQNSAMPQAKQIQGSRSRGRLMAIPAHTPARAQRPSAIGAPSPRCRAGTTTYAAHVRTPAARWHTHTERLLMTLGLLGLKAARLEGQAKLRQRRREPVDLLGGVGRGDHDHRPWAVRL